MKGKKLVNYEEFNVTLEAAIKMAQALRDIHNMIGEDKVVKREFAKVEQYVEQFEYF